MNNLICIVSLRSKTKRNEKNKIRGNNGQPAKHNGLEDKKADKKNYFLIFYYFLLKKYPIVNLLAPLLISSIEVKVTAISKCKSKDA
jgi:hypothetical protein